MGQSNNISKTWGHKQRSDTHENSPRLVLVRAGSYYYEQKCSPFDLKKSIVTIKTQRKILNDTLLRRILAAHKKRTIILQ
jgi:hypothetical protein